MGGGPNPQTLTAWALKSDGVTYINGSPLTFTATKSINPIVGTWNMYSGAPKLAYTYKTPFIPGNDTMYVELLYETFGLHQVNGWETYHMWCGNTHIPFVFTMGIEFRKLQFNDDFTYEIHQWDSLNVSFLGGHHVNQNTCNFDYNSLDYGGLCGNRVQINGNWQIIGDSLVLTTTSYIYSTGVFTSQYNYQTKSYLEFFNNNSSLNIKGDKYNKQIK
jgi:hypothetical protein